MFSILSDKKLHLNRPKRRKQPPARFCDPEQIAKKSKVEAKGHFSEEHHRSKQHELNSKSKAEVYLSKEAEVESNKTEAVHEDFNSMNNESGSNFQPLLSSTSNFEQDNVGDANSNLERPVESPLIADNGVQIEVTDALDMSDVSIVYLNFKNNWVLKSP